MKCFLKITLFAGLITLFSGCQKELPSEIAEAYLQTPERVDFNFHIRPILSDRCFSCHGPDEKSRKANLRLDLEEAAFKKLKSGNGYALVKGKPFKSELIDRILSTDPEICMPIPESNLTLNDQEKAVLFKWVEQGAKWKDHWAFTPPVSISPPKLDGDWTVQNPIDQFVGEKLALEGLKPSPKAEKEVLLRRVSLDLTGLAPSLEEIDDFLADDSPEAFEKVVDRLLESSDFGERMAMDWMDLSRYADSHGMHADGWREMWQWRDWVINAFNDNMPYEQFVSWQLAGDLLPDASQEQKLATAFNRNHPMTAEGGVIEEEFRLGYVFDRAETMSTAFMGLTLACAKCHDHKFDPISQEEYYQTAAFFNNVKELGMTGDDGNYGPMLLMADAETKKNIKELENKIQDQAEQVALTEKELLANIEFIKQLPNRGLKEEALAYVGFERINPLPKRKGQFAIDGNQNYTTRVDQQLQEGKVGQARQFTGDYDESYIHGKTGIFELYDSYSAAAWINTTKQDSNKTQVILGTAGDKNNFWRGWDFYLESDNRLSVRLIHSLPHNYLHIKSETAIPLKEWQHVAFTYDGSAKAEGLKLYINGKLASSSIEYDHLYRSIHPVSSGANLKQERAVRIGKSYRAFTGENGIFKGWIDEVYLFGRSLFEAEIARLADQDTADEAHLKLIQARQEKNYQKEVEALKELKKSYLSLLDPIPEVMVMEEMKTPRSMFVYNRGEYSSPSHEVKAATPEAILAFPQDFPKNRLGLAQWLFSEEHPLTARVTVNRYWQLIFGRGIVNTPQDFGIQGALPSHPELLDWLALEFINSGWDLKQLLKTIVMSATYQQSSKKTEVLLEKDPENIWLARGPSYRLSAEMIRDNALSASGLLVKQIGGQSVRPYQPKGLWIDKGNFSYKLLRYKETRGDSLYRRSLYTFVKRTSPHPAMTVFDAPNRDVCTVKRERTNTPLQALVLLNDPQFVEAARVLAQRIQKEAPNELETQLVQAFRLITSRQPRSEELAIFEKMYIQQLSRFQNNREDASAFLEVGDYPFDEELDPLKTAALAMVASTMLNHDEAYMKR